MGFVNVMVSSVLDVASKRSFEKKELVSNERPSFKIRPGELSHLDSILWQRYKTYQEEMPLASVARSEHQCSLRSGFPDP